MGPLDARDANAVLGAATCIAADPPPDFVAVCDLLRQLIPCQSVSFNDLAMGSGDFRYVIVPEDVVELAEELKPVYDRYVHQHLLVAHALSHPRAGALRFADVPGGDEVTETELFTHFYEPFDIRYQMVIQLPAPPAVIVGYALNRSERQGEFSDRDVAVLNALEGHLAMHHRVLKDLERARAMTMEADRDGWSVVTVRSDGVVEGSSSTSLGSELAPDGAIPPDIASLLPDQSNAQRGTSRHEVMIGDDRWRCVVHPVLVGPSVLLMRHIGDESAAITGLIDIGLTPRQAQVALALARTGAANSDLARSLEMSEGTAKKHLESVFRVLGVESRTAAAVAVGEIIEANERR